jgi:hypothetical protein
MRRFICLTCLALLPTINVSAAATTVPGATYEVDILVFEARLPDLEAGELWIKDTMKPISEDIAEAVSVRGSPSSKSEFFQAAKKLQNDSEYRLLTHKHWVQNAEAKSTTKPIRIDNSATGLDGVLKFYISRFLHIELDLAYREGGGMLTGTESTDPTYRISEQRRLKSREVHYFDHPKFGALVRIAPLENN